MTTRGGRPLSGDGRSADGQWRPRLRPTVESLHRGGDIYFALPGTQPDLHVSQAGLLRRALAVCDGSVAAGELSEALKLTTAEAGELEATLHSLRDLGVLDDARDDRLLSDQEHGRYDRQLRYLADLAPAGASRSLMHRRLRDAHVCVLGVGGLGSWAALALAAAGIGRLTLIDHDHVEESNLARQTLYCEADLGRPKVEAAAQALRALRSDLELRLLCSRVEGSAALHAPLADCQLLLVSADWPSGLIDRWASDACFATGTAFMTVGQHPPILRFGPLLVPGVSGCQACREHQMEQQHRFFRPLADLRAGSSSQAATFAGTSAMLGGYAATEIVHHLAGLPTATLGCAVLMDIRTLSTRREPVSPNPECPACQRVGDAASI